MWLPNITTVVVVALSLSNTVAAHVDWILNFDTNKTLPTQDSCAELRITDYGIGGGYLTIADWTCDATFSGRQDLIYTFNFAGKRKGYSATIVESDVFFDGGFRIIYRTDHGVFEWDTGKLGESRYHFYSKSGRALG